MFIRHTKIKLKMDGFAMDSQTEVHETPNTHAFSRIGKGLQLDIGVCEAGTSLGCLCW